jgi:Na+/melibiose symporter-like transporter
MSNLTSLAGPNAKEKRAYYLGALGQGMMYAIMSSYISDFYLNVMGLGAVFVFLLMLLARVWDAVNDPMMGMIMDRFSPKHGKMRTYLFYLPIPILCFTVLLFWAPNLSSSAKMVYAAITYTLWGMLYTVADIPFWSLPNTLTADPDERGKIFSVASTTNGVGTALPMAIVMLLGPLLAKTGMGHSALEQTKYITAAFIAAGCGGTLYFLTPFKVKERVPIRSIGTGAGGQRGALKRVLRCPPLMQAALCSVLSSGRYMFQAGAIHVARYAFYIGPPLAGMTAAAQEAALQANIAKVQLIFMGVIGVGMFGAMLAVPLLIKRFSYKQLIIFSALLGGVAAMGIYAAGFTNFWVCVPLLLICALPLGVINVVIRAMIGDALDYMEYTTGFRQNGLGQACNSFTQKLGNALATSAIVLTYSAVHLDLEAVSGGRVVNPFMLPNAPQVRQGMFRLVSLIPAISLFACVVPMFFYKLDGEKKREITEGLAIAREQTSSGT